MKSQRAYVLYTLMAFGYAFLYLPIICVVVFSFNQGKSISVWSGWSLRWYASLFSNEQILDAAKLSLQIAVIASSISVVIGTLAGLALARFGKFRGRSMLSLLTSAPLVMPDVMLGISALFLFITLQQWIGWPTGRGIDTITLAHVTLCVCYVTVVVRSRLTQADQSLEEAAMDLGAKPWKVFFLITLPMIWPALIAGWLLAFTLSLDDVVIASFTSGPGSSTLPVLLYSKLRFSLSPEINALTTIIILLVTTLVSIAGYMLHRNNNNAASNA